MGGVLTMPRVELGGWKFRILWNGRAMIEWNQREDADQDIDTNQPERVADMLYLMGREAAAACKAYGYEPDRYPEQEEIRKYFAYAAVPWELNYAMANIDAAILYGSRRDYKPDEDEMIDVDTIALKKN